MTVPAIRPVPFPVAPSVTVLPVNGLTELRLPSAGAELGKFVVMGAGKTGMDAVLFLLGRGCDPGHITWVMPRDPWVIDRAQLQPDRHDALIPFAQLAAYYFPANRSTYFPRISDSRFTESPTARSPKAVVL